MEKNGTLDFFYLKFVALITMNSDGRGAHAIASAIVIGFEAEMNRSSARTK